MAWQTEADRFVNEPVILCSLALDSGTLLWSNGYVRPQASAPYIGRILSLPTISSSIGDLARTFEGAQVSIELADPDRSLRGAATAEGIKNRVLTIKVGFANDELSNARTIFSGRVYSYQPLSGLRFQIQAEQTMPNMNETYPEAKINSTDYPNAPSGSFGQTIQIPWGTVSSTRGPVKAIMVDETQDAEVHLVGLQHGAALSVSNVCLNGVLKTVTTDYTITSATIDGKVHTRISWEAGVRPLEADIVTCDVEFTAKGPVEAVKFFMINFADYADGDFDATFYTNAQTEESNRGYTFDGVMASQHTLAEWLDLIRNEFELDIWYDVASGKIRFFYLGQALDMSTVPEYEDYLDIVGYEPNQNIELIMNWVRPGYNFDYASQNFSNYSFFENAASQTLHGGTYKAFPTLYFVRDADTAYDIAAFSIQRRKDPLEFDSITLPLKAFSLSLGDVVKVTHFDGLGPLGYIDAFFQLRAADLSLDTMLMMGTFENVSSFYGDDCYLGDENALADTWLLASEDEQHYCYMCDEDTGEFSNGDVGKSMNAE